MGTLAGQRLYSPISSILYIFSDIPPINIIKKSHNSPSVKLIWPLSKSLSSSHLVIFPLIQHVNSENWLFAYPLAHARPRQMLLLWENQCLSVLLQCFICEWSEFFASSFYRILERHAIKTAGSDGALYGCKSAWDMNDDEGGKKKKTLREWWNTRPICI